MHENVCVELFDSLIEILVYEYQSKYSGRNHLDHNYLQNLSSSTELHCILLEKKCSYRC
jgi:hypothetical protein